MNGKHRPLPVITAGEPEHGAWCGTCLEPWRLVIPLYADGRPVSRLEVCPGCGSGHDRSSATITAALPEPRVPLAPRLACALHARRCAREGRRSPGCALGDCPWPGLWRNAWLVDDDDRTTYLFCRKAHQRKWAAGNGAPSP